ncbi:MAG: bifunctional adenosylcobinamide kinase/adenosylcobinamide-phosphate guanylyltransferase [Anaerolineales bacterium]|nr:bifunctional adenosylcobinamide kinase/adenosylcobinamide-phosphate guanylyltransferase [Anaerolineales bacterium]MCS7248343.1 bifunctional adenosylcobinamide kinase/adenosylcobinamide-phosphate guanylyltransferase [Anaerolineales bacterium]MDW8162156.1 bifunctional adenosylcobinamide kinase/adenosylcobinamide-phosphate guanylyltransferase [Anaerolineales bacterium]MDW8446711.1 bifunctional adenosylcobinamide kinase/adenosylcobinamide-phosphate guanylyltransferase [Anaerolineales bacterium]
MAKLTLLLGGVRSGKSCFAQELASLQEGLVVYIATAQALDSEMERRVAQHRRERPEHWKTLELPYGVARGYRESGLDAAVVLLDCLTLLVSNVILATCPPESIDPERAMAAVDCELDALLEVIRGSSAHWIVISNEVGMGVVPPYPLGRLYRDILGVVNQRVAAVADEVFLMVAGIPLPLHFYRRHSAGGVGKAS